MPFINWGHETPEQTALRKKIEAQQLFEQAMMRKVFEARGVAAQSASASAGSGVSPVVAENLYIPDYYMQNPEEYSE